MSPILFFINFFTCIGVGNIFLQINSAAVAFIDILIATWEGLIHALEKRYQNKTQLRYNFGSVYEHHTSGLRVSMTQHLTSE